MYDSQNELSREEKINLLKNLIENEDAFNDNQPIYEAYLSDPDPEVRRLATEGLWDYPDPALIAPLMDMAEHDPDQRVRNGAILALGRYVYEGEMADYDYDWGMLEDVMREDELPEADYQRVVAFLLEIARNPSTPLDAQRFAVEALGFSSDPEIADLLEQTYHSPHLDMKVSTLFAMGRSGLTRWNSYILAELDSPEPRLQFEAVRAAGELFVDEATPALLRLAEMATDENLRHEAIWALGHMESLEAWQLLDDIANDPTEDEEMRQVAEAALDEFYMFQEMAEGEFEEEDDEFTEEEDDGGDGRLPKW
jgi:HEAT repeat protein